MYAIQYNKSIPRYLLVRLLGSTLPGLNTSRYSCIRLVAVDAPPLPTAHWVRVKPVLSGICGSDLATIGAKGSPYFSPFTSTPFILGHEIVGEVVEVGSAVQRCAVGDRVVIEPTLSCHVRGITVVCPSCRKGHYGHCENITRGDIAAGVQTGYCRDTGGGWSSALVAHETQIYPVPDTLSDEEAVLIEPFSCALHAVLSLSLPLDPAMTILIFGCGTMGLLTLAALRALDFSGRILAIAKYPHQQELAQRLDADTIIPLNSALYSTFCQLTKAEFFQPELGKPVLLGGVEVTFDCVGSSTSIDDALRFTRPRGKVILVGMPGNPRPIDWTSIWYKGLQVQGSYTSGMETYQGQMLPTFRLAIQLLQRIGSSLKPLIGARFPLTAYRQAIDSALHTNRSQSVKTVFVF
jgi:threonine dehydrogenase-like Zn-dependent dehydrogenase